MVHGWCEVWPATLDPYMYQTKIKYIFFSSFKYIPSRHITKTAPDAYVNYTFYHVLYTCM